MIVPWIGDKEKGLCKYFVSELTKTRQVYIMSEEKTKEDVTG